MKRVLPVCLFHCLFVTFSFCQSNSTVLTDPSAKVLAPANLSPVDSRTRLRILESYGKLPLHFEDNQGQTDTRVKFLSHANGYSIFLTSDEALLELRNTVQDKSVVANIPGPHPSMVGGDVGRVVRMKLRNANLAAKITGAEELAGTNSYFIGNDPAKWRTHVPTYARVKYEGIYSGIDLVYYGNQRQLEYDFIVAPGGDPRHIQFDIRGANRIHRGVNGDLVLKIGADEIRWRNPTVYQESNGTRQLIPAHYVITDVDRVGFQVSKYDTSRTLYIDPVLYSTYLGGQGGDSGAGIALDGGGNVYVTGSTASANFPVTAGALQTVCGSCVFVTKLNPSGSALVYSTLVGGSAQQWGTGIAVDSAGDAYITGLTSSTDFPTLNPAQAVIRGSFNAFVFKLDSTGSALVYSTYLGGSGSDQGSGIGIDSAGNAIVAGWTTSTDFPTKHPLQSTYGGGDYDAFVSKLDPAGSALIYSTYLGGSSSDQALGIAVDSSGNASITGWTSSTDFPTKAALQPYGGGSQDAFVAKINSAGSALVYSTYLGGSNFDQGYAIAVDSSGNAYVSGSTQSPDFPTTPGAFETSCYPYCQYGSFVTKINSSGTALAYSTYFATQLPYGIAVDAIGDAHLTGSPWAFVAELDATGSSMLYSIPLGLGKGIRSPTSVGAGIALDNARGVYIIGSTGDDFQIVNAFQPVFGGGSSDAFVTKFTIDFSSTQLTSSVNPALYGKPIIFTATVSSPSGGTPTGKVTFLIPDVGDFTRQVLKGKATFTYSKLPLGLSTVTAYYSGDSSFIRSGSTPLNQIVLAGTTATLTSSANPSLYGQPVTFTATVSSGIGAPPDGEIVTFKKAGIVLGTGTFSGGSAAFTISTLPVGTGDVTAIYGGDTQLGASTSKVLKQVVNKQPTATTLSSSQNPANVGQSVTFTATVAPQIGGTPTGTVVFYDGTNVLKTKSLSGGVAAFTTSTLTSGSHTIKAAYSGSSKFGGSSAMLVQTEN
jgi:hypothetical protein